MMVLWLRLCLPSGKACLPSVQLSQEGLSLVPLGREGLSQTIQMDM